MITKLITDGISSLEPKVLDENPEVSQERFRENILKLVSQILPENNKVKFFAEELSKYLLNKEKDAKKQPTETKKKKEDSASEKRKKMREAMKFLIDFTGDVLHTVTKILPEGFGIRKYFDGLIDSVKGLAHVVNEPDAAGKFIGAWVKNISDITGKIITGKFSEIDWIQAAKDSQLSLILTIVNPVLGAVTSTAIAGTDLILQTTGNSKDGDNKVELGDVLGVVQSSLGMIGEIKNVIGSNISKVSEISPNDAQAMQEVYGELGELENSTYKYEKLVSAELYDDAAVEAGKIQAFTQKVMSKFNGGLPTGGASKVENVDMPMSQSIYELSANYDVIKPDSQALEAINTETPKFEVDIDTAIYNTVLQNLNNRSFGSTKDINSIIANLPKAQTNMPNIPQNISYRNNNLPNNVPFKSTNQNFRAQNAQKINDLVKLLNSAPNSYNKSQTDLLNMILNKDPRLEELFNLNSSISGIQLNTYSNNSNQNMKIKTGFNDSLLNQINNKKNANYKDARDFMNIALDGPKNVPQSKEYKFISSDFNDKLNKDLNLTGNMVIPKNWDGFIFKENSSISKNISDSTQFQNQVKNQFDNKSFQFKNNRINLSFTDDPNLVRSIGHATVLKPKIDQNGYFTGLVIDKYDFDWDEKGFMNDAPELSNVNNKAYLLQTSGYIKNYYVIIPVKFKWNNK